VLSLSYNFEDFETKDNFTGTPETTTHFLKTQANYFNPQGVFFQLGTLYVHQSVDFDPESADFVLIDLGVGYRLPRRLGIIQFGIKNLADQDFHYQGLSLRTNTNEQENQPFSPERTIFSEVTLSF